MKLVILPFIVISALFGTYWAVPLLRPAEIEVVLDDPSPPSPVFLELAPVEPWLLPDLVPFPARDVSLSQMDGETFLRFSTTYFNQGSGPLELAADEAVFQRIKREDGGSDDFLVGNFLWHEPHLHYHFKDFIEYDLIAVDAPDHPDLAGVRVKATFCVRDVSRVGLELENRSPEGEYLICGKERQGVSVGWGDTYFSTYPDQELNISDISSGTYRLTFTANPELRLKEERYDNNESSVLLAIDKERGTVEVLEETPANMPAVEHVYLEQQFQNLSQ